MSEAIDWLSPVVAAAERANPPADGDYLDDEGLLVCGKCHTRRQKIIQIPGAVSTERHELKVMVQCRCRREADEAQKRRWQMEKEMDAVKSLKAKSLMDDRLVGAVFSSFQVTRHNAQNLKLCRRYAERFEEMMRKNQGLLFYGNVGTGKTYAAACIANFLLERRTSVVMTSFVKLLDTMQKTRDDDQILIGRLNQARLLIIDDLGAERGTEYALEKVYDIIDSRYRARLPIILTTNLTLEEMKRATDTRYARIYDRIFELCYPVMFAGPSWRKVAANRRFEEMKTFLEG